MKIFKKTVFSLTIIVILLFAGLTVNAASNKVGNISSGMPTGYYAINTRFVNSSGYIQFYQKRNVNTAYAEISRNGTIYTLSFSMNMFTRNSRALCSCGPYGESYVYGGLLEARKKSSLKWIFTYTLQTGNTLFSDQYSIVYNYTLPSTGFTTSRLVKDYAGNYRIAWIAKSSSQITGYELQVSRSSRFTYASTYRISNPRQNYIGINKNMRGTFYLRIRTYKRVNGITYYSTWCNKGLKVSL